MLQGANNAEKAYLTGGDLQEAILQVEYTLGGSYFGWCSVQKADNSEKAYLRGRDVQGDHTLEGA